MTTTTRERPARRKPNAAAVPAPGDAALVWPAAGEGDTKPDGSPNRWATADVLTWTTTCGRYRVYRIDSMSRERVHFGACYRDGNGTWMSCEDERKDGWHPRYYRRLELAMEAAERKHAVRANLDAPPASNRAAVCAALGELAMSVGPVVASPAPTPSENGEVAPSKPDTIIEGVKAPAAKREKPRVSRNEFGSRPGSAEARADAVLTRTPKTMKEVVVEAGVGTVYNHFNKLVKEGKVVKEGGGYRLP